MAEAERDLQGELQVSDQTTAQGAAINEADDWLQAVSNYKAGGHQPTIYEIAAQDIIKNLLLLLGQAASRSPEPWQPIETLLIESRVLLWCVPVKNPGPGAMVVTGTRTREQPQSIWMAAGGYWSIDNFTHWRPLPDPPGSPLALTNDDAVTRRDSRTITETPQPASTDEKGSER